MVIARIHLSSRDAASLRPPCAAAGRALRWNLVRGMVMLVLGAAFVGCGETTTGADATTDSADVFDGEGDVPRVPRPRLVLNPYRIDFEIVPQGTTVQKMLSVLNPGDAPLVIDSFVLSGHPNYRIHIGAQSWPVSTDTSAAGITLDPPLIVEAGAVFDIGVEFSATNTDPAEGQLVLFSNDPLYPSGSPIKFSANATGPCIRVNPRQVDFGGRLVGRTARVTLDVTSCGSVPLEITEMFLLPGSSPELSLDLTTFNTAATDTHAFGAQDPPVVLHPNQFGRFVVEYLPEDISPIDEDHQPLRDLGTLRIKSNAAVSELDVDIQAFGVDRECPSAVIDLPQGDEVIPQTVLNLVGSGSFAAQGAIATWKWRVIQPTGSRSVFKASDSSPDVTFEVNVAGIYVFELDVTDSMGQQGCAPARFEVFVNPDQALHIELLWDTPGDVNQTDEGPNAGTDLDLHFKHPFAVGEGFDGDGDGRYDGWFDETFDTYWFNHSPNWGNPSSNILDNPSLDRDDTDGTGPETINFDLPEHGLCYEIGAHYWESRNFGNSFATLRVYQYGSLVLDVPSVELTERDMWWAAEVCWPPTNVAPVARRVCEGTNQSCTSPADCSGGQACGYKITPSYEHPFLPAPSR